MRDLFTVQTEDEENGLSYYETFLDKRYARKMFEQQSEKLQRLAFNGAVTFFVNHEFVEEFVAYA
jgi:hypothetical protein